MVSFGRCEKKGGVITDDVFYFCLPPFCVTCCVCYRDYLSLHLIVQELFVELCEGVVGAIIVQVQGVQNIPGGIQHIHYMVEENKGVQKVKMFNRRQQSNLKRNKC